MMTERACCACRVQVCQCRQSTGAAHPQVCSLAQEVQHITGESVTLIFVDKDIPRPQEPAQEAE